MATIISADTVLLRNVSSDMTDIDIRIRKEHENLQESIRVLHGQWTSDAAKVSLQYSKNTLDRIDKAEKKIQQISNTTTGFAVTAEKINYTAGEMARNE